jgi:heterodisulfide reductase subunit C
MRVKLSAETLRNELVRRIEEISGEDLLKCYQCGKCAAGCPAAFAMDMLPSQVIRFAQLGLVEEVLNSETPWFCLSRIMEAVREIVLQERGDYIDLSTLSPDDLAEFPQQAFIASFRKYTA